MGKVYELIIECGDADDSFETKIRVEAEDESECITSKGLAEALRRQPPDGHYYLRPIDKIRFREVE